MIVKDDLKRIAEGKKLSLRNCEKDYFLDMVLYSLSDIKKQLVFKGGTALYKFYNLNRFSEDIDLDLTGRRKDASYILTKVNRNLMLLGVGSMNPELDDHRNETNIRLRLRGPLYDGSRSSVTTISINLSKRERPLEISTKMYVPAYSDIPAFQFPVLTSKEIAAEKFRCILTRDKPRDIYDLWFLSKRGAIPEIDMINKKLELYGIEYEKRALLEKVLSMEDLWNRDLKGMIIGDLPRFRMVLEELSEAIPK